MSDKSLKDVIDWVRTDLAYKAPEQMSNELLMYHLNEIFEAADREDEASTGAD